MPRRHSLSVQFNHTIVHARDNRESAEFFAGLLGLEVSGEWGPFVAVALAGGVTLDFATVPEEHITPQHYAFLVSEEEFDAAYARIVERGIEHYADPHRRQPGTINQRRRPGVYFMDPAGHAMELITVPYGGWPS